MIHRRAAAFGSTRPSSSRAEAQARRDIAEKTEGNGMCELRNVRDKLICDFASKLLPLLHSLRSRRLCGE